MEGVIHKSQRFGDLNKFQRSCYIEINTYYKNKAGDLNKSQNQVILILNKSCFGDLNKSQWSRYFDTYKL